MVTLNYGEAIRAFPNHNHKLWFIIYIKVEILYDSTTGFHKPMTNYLLNTTAQTVQPTMQPTFSQRCNCKTKFSQVSLAIYKLTLQTKPNHRTA